MHAWLASASMLVNRMTGGEADQYLCARLAEKWGAHSWPCRLIDLFAGPGHCRRIWFDWTYRK